MLQKMHQILEKPLLDEKVSKKLSDSIQDPTIASTSECLYPKEPYTSIWKTDSPNILSKLSALSDDIFFFFFQK